MSDLRQEYMEIVSKTHSHDFDPKVCGICDSTVVRLFATFKKMLPEAETNGLMIENIGVYLQGKNAYRKEVLERLDAK